MKLLCFISLFFLPICVNAQSSKDIKRLNSIFQEEISEKKAKGEYVGTRFLANEYGIFKATETLGFGGTTEKYFMEGILWANIKNYEIRKISTINNLWMIGFNGVADVMKKHDGNTGIYYDGDWYRQKKGAEMDWIQFNLQKSYVDEVEKIISKFVRKK